MRHALALALIAALLAPAVADANPSRSYRKSVRDKRSYRPSVARMNVQRRAIGAKRTKRLWHKRRTTGFRAPKAVRRVGRTIGAWTNRIRDYRSEQRNGPGTEEEQDGHHFRESMQRLDRKQRRDQRRMNRISARQRRFDYGVSSRAQRQLARQQLIRARRLEGPRFRVFRSGSDRGSLRRLGNLLRPARPFTSHRAASTSAAQHHVAGRTALTQFPSALGAR